MKKAGIALSVLLLALCFVLFLSFDKIGSIWSQNVKKQSSARAREAAKVAPAVPGFPSFYKGIYLTSNSGKDFKKLQKYVSMAQEGRLNTLVIDVQDSRIKESAIPKQNIDYCIEKGFHTVARVVVFPDGLKKYPVDPQYIANKLAVAENACKLGFREIQFDYIRFNDHGILKKIPLKEKYAFIENFLRKARAHLKPYNVRIAADVFGRIPLNKHDPIGQRMEGLDEVADVICPMAYPSHYTWSKKLMSDPYTTVFITSKKAKERVTRAHIV
ncbi:MAG TPA: putative glycoside hydrolase, partial [Spirochaetota bacterium]|nr:putative glycoside hydrolase [Spirochaetota bacterium]